VFLRNFVSIDVFKQLQFSRVCSYVCAPGKLCMLHAHKSRCVCACAGMYSFVGAYGGVSGCLCVLVVLVGPESLCVFV
jgi:hypothetical protein